MPTLKRVSWFASVFLLIAVVVHAATLSGEVTYQAKPVSGAVVTANLLGAKGPVSVSVARTDDRGGYTLNNLRNGKYILLVDVNGKRVYEGRLALTGSALVKNIALR
jgi:hypothetical protein